MIDTQARTGGDGPDDEPARYGYPPRIAAGYVRPEGETLDAFLTAEGIRDECAKIAERRVARYQQRGWAIALGVLILLLALTWLTA